jgi:hypothetical protein
VPATLALCLLASACGGSSGASSDGVASAGGAATKTGADDDKKTDPEKAGLDFARCMREHGVDMPDPKADAGGMVMIGPGGDPNVARSSEPEPGFAEANKACEHHLGGLIGEGPGQMDAEAQDKALKFARCMRENGVDMPDPDFSGGGLRITIGGPGAAGPDQETMRKAQEKCGATFGAGGGFGTAPGTRS